VKKQVYLNRAVLTGLLVTTSGLALLVTGGAVLVLGHRTLAASTPTEASDVWLYVTAMGAKCNGSTDDTAAIQSAIDTSWTKGGIVMFPAGTCVVSNLIWRQGVVLRGEGTAALGNGRGTVLRQKANVTAGLALIQTDTDCSFTDYQHHSVIEWMTLQGDATNATSDGVDFNCRVGENTRFEHLKLVGFGRSGLVFDHGAAPLTMFDVHVFGSGSYGIDITRTKTDNNQMVILQMISGDDNGASLIHIGRSGSLDDFVINGVKCEKHTAGKENDCILLENMGGGVLAINGVGYTNTSGEIADAVVRINYAGEPRLSFTALAKQQNPTAIKYTVNDTISGLTTISASGSIGDSLHFESNLVVSRTLQAGGALQIGDTAVTWTSAGGVPTNNCTTGSLRSRTDGGTGSTLYVCEAGVWTAK
jgi:hypothetical protein